jgi:2-polyprenyl-6-methoxyphenol hydroxylase-like FAD-dependent oxidoreductase
VSPVRTVLGAGVAGLACALFAARHGPVRVCDRPPTSDAASVESVPAATLTLLLELGITPAELGVDRLVRCRTVAWDGAEPRTHPGPACAHVDRAALHVALRDRAATHPAVTLAGRVALDRAGPGCVDATGRRALGAATVHRPPRTWTASTVTTSAGASPDDGHLRLAAAADGYTYRLGSGRLTTLGWVGPGRVPRDAAALLRRVDDAGAGWLLGGFAVPADRPTHRRPAGAALPVACGDPRPVGDAALARDALAAQGTAIALSDACLAADPEIPAALLARRRTDATARHLHHLSAMVAACRFADAPVWAEYAVWLAEAAAGRWPQAASAQR